MKEIYSVNEVREQVEKTKILSKKVLKEYIEQINDEITEKVALGEEIGMATFAKAHRDYMKKMLEEFKNIQGATCCRILTKGYEFHSPERKEHCVKMVEGASKILLSIIKEKISTKV